MRNFIQEIITRFGGRIAGEPNTIEAQKWVANEWKPHCDEVVQEEIRASMTAKFESLKLFVILHFASLALFWVNIPAAAFLALANAILFTFHFSAYYDWLDFLFPAKRDINVVGVIEPEKEVKQTFLVAGHIDSVYEFHWWYKLKGMGGHLTFMAGLTLTVLPLFLLPIWIFGGMEISTVGLVIWGIFAALSPLQILFFWIHDKSKVVDGASDNLSGVAIAYDVARHFGKTGKHKLQHTRIRVISFAAEEPGLKGSREYARRHEAALKKEGAVLLNSDTIRVKNELTILKGETNCFASFPKKWVEELQTSFENIGHPAKTDWLLMGASDSVSLQRKGIPSVTVVGISTRQLDPSYHTRLDTLEYQEPEALEAVRDAFIDVIARADARACS